MKTVFRLSVCCLLATSFFLVGCGEGGTAAPAGDDTSASAEGGSDTTEASTEEAGSGDTSGGSGSN